MESLSSLSLENLHAPAARATGAKYRLSMQNLLPIIASSCLRTKKSLADTGLWKGKEVRIVNSVAVHWIG